MHGDQIVGVWLVAGLILFFVGAGAWRLEYERPMAEALLVIHADRRRRAWIHLWMIPAMFVTSGGVAGYAVSVSDREAALVAAIAAVVYAMGAVCWIASLAFRLTVVPWAAKRTVEDGTLPEGFAALDHWAASLYAVHMASAYAAFPILGWAVLEAGDLPRWSGWLGIGWGSASSPGSSPPARRGGSAHRSGPTPTPV